MSQSLKKFASGDGDQYLQELDLIGSIESTHNIPISDSGTGRLHRLEIGSLFVAAGLEGGQTVYGGTEDGDNLIIRSSSGVLGEVCVYGSSVELFIGTERFLWGGNSDGVFVGKGAGVVSYEGSNVGIGRQSLASLSGGDSNVGAGYRSLVSLTSGDNNIGIGYNASSVLIGGSDNVVIGYSSGTGGTNISDCVIIGSGARSLGTSDVNSITIGNDAVGLGSNSVVLGNSSILKTKLFGDIGVGIDSAAAGLHIIKTSEQLRLGYDSANYLAVGVGSTGTISFIPSAGPIQFYSANNSPAYGSELVTDGDFGSGSNWTKGSGWTVSGGVATCNGTSSILSQNITGLVSGKSYRISFTVNKTSGTLNISLGSFGVISSWPLPNGVNSFEGSIICRNSSSLLSFASNSFVGSIDNVSLKLINTATPAFSLYNLSPVGEITFRADSSSIGIGGGLQIINPTQNNSLFGANAGYHISYGSNNVGLGASSQFCLTYGDDNVGIGYQAQYGNYGGFSGDKNIGIGTNAQYSILFGGDNVAIGYQSQYILTNGNKNVGVGNYSLTSLTTGGGNVAIGDNAATSLSSGSNNTCIGYQSNTDSATDTNSIVVGYGATGLGSNSVALGNTSITKTRLYGSVGIASGVNTTANDPDAIMHVIGSDEQLRVGYDIDNYLSVSVNSTGTVNFNAVGSAAKLAFDSISLVGTSSATVGVIFRDSNRFIHNYGTNNTFLGVNSGNFTLAGERNTGIGVGSLSSVTTSSNNIAIGYFALEACGNNNVGIGNTAGSAAAHVNCVFVGHGVEVGLNPITNSVVIGYGASSLGDDSVVLGNSSVTRTRLYGGVGVGGDPDVSADGNLQIIGVGGTKRVTISVDASDNLVNFLGSDSSLNFNFLNNSHFNGLSTGDINSPDVGVTQDIQVSVPSGTRTLSFKNGLLVGVATP